MSVKHGTRTRYIYHGCRCERCKGANATYQRGAARRRSTCVPERVHGTYNGYSNYRCRCAPCRATAVEMNRCYRERAV